MNINEHLVPTESEKSGYADRLLGIAVDGNGNAYVTGDTTSTEATFPVTVGPDLTFNGGYDDAFVAKVVFEPEPPPKPKAMPWIPLLLGD
jgi:hypothetical protein